MAKDQFGGVDVDEFGGISVEDEAPTPYEGPSGLGAVTFGGAARPAAPVIAPPPAWDAWTGEASEQLNARAPWMVPSEVGPPPSLTPESALGPDLGGIERLSPTRTTPIAPIRGTVEQTGMNPWQKISSQYDAGTSPNDYSAEDKKALEDYGKQQVSESWDEIKKMWNATPLSFVNFTPEQIPSGKEISQITGIPEALTVPFSSVEKALAGFLGFMTSANGLTQIAAAGIPVVRPIIMAKWIGDMLAGGGEAAAEFGKAIAEKDYQRASDALVNYGSSALMLAGGRVPFTKARLPGLIEGTVHSVLDLGKSPPRPDFIPGTDLGAGGKAIAGFRPPGAPVPRAEIAPPIERLSPEASADQALQMNRRAPARTPGAPPAPEPTVVAPKPETPAPAPIKIGDRLPGLVRDEEGVADTSKGKQPEFESALASLPYGSQVVRRGGDIFQKNRDGTWSHRPEIREPGNDSKPQGTTDGGGLERGTIRRIGEESPVAPAAAGPPFLGADKSTWTPEYLADRLTQPGNLRAIVNAVNGATELKRKFPLKEDARPETILKAIHDLLDARAKATPPRPPPPPPEGGAPVPVPEPPTKPTAPAGAAVTPEAIAKELGLRYRGSGMGNVDQYVFDVPKAREGEPSGITVTVPKGTSEAGVAAELSKRKAQYEDATGAPEPTAPTPPAAPAPAETPAAKAATSTPTAEGAKGIGGQAFKDLRDKLDRNEGGGRDFTKSLVDAGTFLYEKGMKFADWSARMVKEFGENVRSWLQSVWTRITDLADFDVQLSAQYNQPYIPVKIRGTDGKMYDAQFNGHYDMRAYGGGLNYSIGREISPGHWSHGLLRPGEKLMSRVPSPEKWSKLKAAEKARTAVPITLEREAGAGIPPISIPGIDKLKTEVVRSAKDFHLFNRINSPQFLYYFGKLGQAAKSAWETMALGEFQMREATRRDVETAVRQPLLALPRAFRKQGGKALFDVINGKTMDDIRAEWQGKPNGESVIAQAGIVKGRLEEIRTTIRDLKRDSFNRYLNGVNKDTLQDLFRENVSREADISRMTKEELADAVSREQFPDDWGISDGSYLPHLFFGQWKVTVRRPGSEGSQFITRSQTIQEAKARIYEQTKADPALNDAHFTIEQDTVVPADMIRLGDRRFWNLVGKMKEQNMEPAAVQDALRGNIGRKSTKQKWFGSLQERQGFEGYSKNYERAMIAYLSGFHRWRVLNEVNQKTQPLIEQVRREGRLNAAQNLEYILDNLWGKPTVATREFDAFMRRIPVARDFIKPMALDRWARAATQLTGLLTLRTLRFSVVNRLQPLQGLYPLIGERGIIEAKIMQHTDAGRKLLQEAGVELDPGQYASELSGTSARRSIIERFSGERSNQELAFLGMYQHARKLGISHAEAVVYGKLRGQLMTQFTPLLTDTPALFNGPFGRVMFQFKRFPVKQVELMSKMVSDRNVPAIARLVASFGLLGGLSFLLRQTWATDNDTRLKIKRSLDKSLGTKGGDALMYGLPGYMGADISGSITLGDEPIGQNIYEKGARLLTGPAISLGIQTAQHLTTSKRQPTTKVQDAENLLRRFPLTKPMAELSGLLRGDIDVHTPDGETKLHRNLKDALMGLGSFRSANEANISLAVNGIIALTKEESRLKNNYYASSDKAEAIKEIIKFNQMWPEAAINAEGLDRYVKYREAGRNKTDAERIARKKYQLLLPPSQRLSSKPETDEFGGVPAE